MINNKYKVFNIFHYEKINIAVFNKEISIFDFRLFKKLKNGYYL